jgi:hypothetical protein
MEQGVMVENPRRKIDVQSQAVSCISGGDGLPEVRCPKCDRLWFKGVLVGEIRCRCKFMVVFTVEATPIDDQPRKN